MRALIKSLMQPSMQPGMPPLMQLCMSTCQDIRIVAVWRQAWVILATVACLLFATAFVPAFAQPSSPAFSSDHAVPAPTGLPSTATATPTARVAAGEPAFSSLESQVTDQTGSLSDAQIEKIEAQLRALEQEKGAQIAVVMIKSTDGEPIEQYAVRVFEHWQLGRKGVDDGILLLIAKDDRALRIEVGYGLEGAVTDAQANRIIREQITPRFANGDFAGGVEAGVNSLIALVNNEALPPPRIRQVDGSQSGSRGATPSLELLLGMAVIIFSMPVWVGIIAGASLGFILTGSLHLIPIGAFAGGLISLLGRFMFRGKGGTADLASRRGRSRGALAGGISTGGFSRGSRSSGSSSRSSSRGGFSGGGGRSGGGGASGRW